MQQKQKEYKALIDDVREAYPSYDPTYSGKEVRLFWCDECKEINLWTYWQGKNCLDAKIMLVGQDWGSPWDESAKPIMQKITLSNEGAPFDYMDGNNSITDNNLCELFRVLGYDISKPNNDLFFTNFILGYRHRGCSGNYSKKWEQNARGYFNRLANIIEPKVIICLGRSTFEGVLSAFGKKQRIRRFNQFIESNANPVPVALNSGETAYVFALAHCGAMGTLNRNRGKEKTENVLDVQKEDWKRIDSLL